MSANDEVHYADLQVLITTEKKGDFWEAHASIEDLLNADDTDVSVTATSYRRGKAVAYALEDLAAKILEEFKR